MTASRSPSSSAPAGYRFPGEVIAIAVRWYVDETYVKVAGRWPYLYGAVDQYGQVIDVLVATRRDAARLRGYASSWRRPVPTTSRGLMVNAPLIADDVELAGTSPVLAAQTLTLTALSTRRLTSHSGGSSEA